MTIDYKDVALAPATAYGVPGASVWDPIRIGRLSLEHRFAMSPMTRSRALYDGTPGASAATYYSQRAGLGLLISEGTQPSPAGQGYLATPGIYTDAHVQGWTQVTEAVHAAGGHLFIQLMHAGRFGHPANTPHHRRLVAPSPVAAAATVFTARGTEPAPVPRALTTDEVRQTVLDFKYAARRAVEAGADGVEIHAAGGYLAHSFLGVHSNLRTDRYGGSMRNRARFVLEVAEAVATEIGADRTAFRFSPHNTYGDVDEGPQALELYEYLTEELNQMGGLAYLHLYDFSQDPVVAATRRAWHGPLLVVRDGRQPEHLLDDLTAGLSDMVPVGRLAVSNPDFVERWRAGGPFTPMDPDTVFGGDDRGYIDYPRLAS